jgi:hypothetical protein
VTYQRSISTSRHGALGVLEPGQVRAPGVLEPGHPADQFEQDNAPDDPVPVPKSMSTFKIGLTQIASGAMGAFARTWFWRRQHARAGVLKFIRNLWRTACNG